MADWSGRSYLYAWPVDRELLSTPCGCRQIIEDLFNSLLKVSLLLSRLLTSTLHYQTLLHFIFSSLILIMIHFLNRRIPFWQCFETANIFAVCELLLVKPLHFFTSLDYWLENWLSSFAALMVNYHAVRVVPWKHNAFLINSDCRRHENLFTLVSFHLSWLVFHRTLSFHLVRGRWGHLFIWCFFVDIFHNYFLVLEDLNFIGG